MKAVTFQAHFRKDTFTVTVSPIDGHLRRYKWKMTLQGHVFRNTSQREAGHRWPRCRRVYLHREIMGLQRGNPLVVDHLNGDPLDNQRTNLQVVTKAENIRRGHLVHARQPVAAEVAA